jgi:hypothetical protein
MALYKGQEVLVNVFSGSSVLAPGQDTGSTAVIDRVLSPLASDEIGTIRCIGLNVCFSEKSKCALPNTILVQAACCRSEYGNSNNSNAVHVSILRQGVTKL